MKRIALLNGAVTLLAAIVAAPANAQDMAPGTWTGTIAPPGMEPIPVTYDVARTDGALSIVMKSVSVMGEMPFRDVRIDESALTFWWESGVRLDCSLVRTPAGGYEGTCTDGTGPTGEGALTMVPPGP